MNNTPETSVEKGRFTPGDIKLLGSIFATKKDLEGFATKKDLEGFATKKDLEGFATKKDLEEKLKDYPTKKDLKEELKKYATKKDLKNTEQSLRQEIQASEKRQGKQFQEGMQIVNHSFQGVQEQMGEIISRMDQINMNVDHSLAIATAALQEVQMHANGRAGHNEVDYRVEVLEKRVDILEVKHAQA